MVSSLSAVRISVREVGKYFTHIMDMIKGKSQLNLESIG